jgi:polyphosphate glucokinase
MHKVTGHPVVMLNDGDAAGMAEDAFGAGKDVPGTVAIFTFGTGIGSAFFIDGVLFPNTEMGHLLIRGKDAEKRASAKVKEDKDLKWQDWAERVNEFFVEIDKLFTPDLIIVGGGISKKFDKFGKYLKSNAKIVPAKLLNDAGIVGAAMAASKLHN